MTYKALIRLILNLKLLISNIFACFEFYHVWEKMPTSMYTNLIIHTRNSLKIRPKEKIKFMMFHLIDFGGKCLIFSFSNFLKLKYFMLRYGLPKLAYLKNT